MFWGWGFGFGGLGSEVDGQRQDQFPLFLSHTVIVDTLSDRVGF